nr:long-chain fatty acid--CoA ligase [Rhodococcus sp. 15-1154-1]
MDTLNRALTLDSVIRRAGRKFPESVAIRHRERSETYRTLNEHVDNVARQLAGLGISSGARVGILMHNSIDMVETLFGALRIAAIAVPINFRLTAAEIAYIVEDSGLTVLVVDPELDAVARGAVSELADPPVVTTTAQMASADETRPFGPVRPAEHDPAFIMYTSGTTGRPKGAVLSHMNLVVHTMNVVATLGMASPDEVILTGMPIFHIGGLDVLLYPLLGGGRTILADTNGFDARHIVATMESENVTTAIFVPTQIREICAVEGIAQRELVLERICWGASSAPPSILAKLVEVFPLISVYALFGQTEMSSATCILDMRAHPERIGSVGRAVMNVEVRIVDGDGQDVAVGEVGEIVYRGPTVMQGYWKNPGATKDALSGGWMHSGDLCRMDEDGFVYVVDRVKDMVISGGENIYCAEVERIIDGHPAVADVAVIGIPHPKWVETPVAIIVPTNPANVPSAADIIAHCRQYLAGYKCPSEVLVVTELPRNATGKIQKFVLRNNWPSLDSEQSTNGPDGLLKGAVQ